MNRREVTANVLRILSLVLCYVTGALIGRGAESFIEEHILDK